MPALDDRPAIADSEPAKPEVLIEEARRRQRRRRLTAAWAVVLVAAIAIAFGVTSGDEPPAVPQTAGGGGAPVGAPAASWRELAAGSGYVDMGEVGAVTEFHGRLILAGWGFGQSPPTGLGCSILCNPVVWVHGARGRWRAVFATQAWGGLAGERFSIAGGRLLMFNSQQGTRLWESSDGLVWRAVRLPAEMEMAMDGLGSDGGVASTGSRVVAVFNNQYVGTPMRAWGESDFVWTSTDGIQWHHDADATHSEPQFDSLSTAPHGFVATSTSRVNGRSIIWFSRNGLSWSCAPINAWRGGHDLITAGPGGFVLERVPDYDTRGHPAVQLWRSSDGRSWTRARISGLGPAYQGQAMNVPRLLATADGFVAYDQLTGRLWWSSTGETWSRLTPSGSPPAILEPQAISVDGNSLLFAEQAQHPARGIPSGATSVWQLTLP
jgi:hypothetical protein